MKSRFTERPDDPACAIRRAGEATAIRDAVLTRFPTPAEARFLILGDTNDSSASKTLEHLEKRGKTEIAALLPAVDPRGDSWTYAYRRDETYTRVDYILVSPGLRSLVQGGAAQVFDGAGVRGASDHRPVIMTLALGSKK